MTDVLVTVKTKMVKILRRRSNHLQTHPYYNLTLFLLYSTRQTSRLSREVCYLLGTSTFVFFFSNLSINNITY